MCVEISDAPKLYRKYVETRIFVAVSGQWALGENIRSSSYWKIYIHWMASSDVVSIAIKKHIRAIRQVVRYDSMAGFKH